jgi:hypothetical protein
LIIYFRKPFAFAGHEIWAEDAYIVLNEIVRDGVYSVFNSYAGVYNFLPRIVGLFSYYLFGIASYITGNVIGIVFLTFIFLFITCLSRAPGVFKFSLILSITIAPHSGEVFGVLTNLQYISSACICVLLVQHPQKHREDFVLDMVLIFIAANGPYLMFLAPFFAIRYMFMKTSKYETVTVLIVSLICVLYVIAALFLGNRGGVFHFPDGYELALIGIAAIKNVLGGALLASSQGDQWGIVAGSIVLAFFMYTLFRSENLTAGWKEYTPERFGSVLALGYAFGMFGASFLRIGDANIVWMIVPDSPHVGDRYVYGPIAIVMALLMWSAAASSVHVRLVALALVCVSVLSATTAFFSRPYVLLRTSDYLELARHRQILVPLNPVWAIYPGWHIDLGPANFASPNSGKFEAFDVDQWKLAERPIDIDGQAKALQTNAVVILTSPLSRCVVHDHLFISLKFKEAAEGWVSIQSLAKKNHESWPSYALFSSEHTSELVFNATLMKKDADVEFSFIPTSSSIWQISSVKIYCVK